MAWYKLDEEGNIEGLLKPLAPLINYVARLNGADQYWQLSEPIDLLVGDELIVFAKRPAAPATRKQWFISGTTIRVNVQANNKIEEVGGDLYIDEVLATNYTTEYPVDGLVHELRYDITSSSLSASKLGVAPSGVTEFLEGIIFDFKVIRGGTVIHEIPLTNKDQGATQLATVGSVNATMVNYDESVWEVLPELWYNKTTGMVICSDKLIECNDEVIPCL